MRFSGSSTEEPEINLVSLIDVVFCVIIFLVVTTTFDVRTALKLELPQAQSTAAVEQDEPITILIDNKGTYFINNNEVLKTDVATLKDAITRLGGTDTKQMVIIRADGRASHQSVITAMDALGQLGFTRLRMATTPERGE